MLIAVLLSLLFVSEVLRTELFVALAAVLVGVLVAYAVTRPMLAVRAGRWALAHPRRTFVVAALTAAALTTGAVLNERITRPELTAEQTAALWADAGARLGAVAAADLRWQGAKDSGKSEASAVVRKATANFRDVTIRLERVRPPEQLRYVHASRVAIYRDMSDLLANLPVALDDADMDAASAIWRVVDVLNQEADALTRMTTPP